MRHPLAARRTHVAVLKRRLLPSDHRANPLVEPYRSLLSKSDVRRLEGLERDMVRAHRRADLAYERGDYWIAETEDARADALAEQLEAEIAEITEDFEKTQEREAEQWAFWPDPANYLASQYAEWVSGRSPHFRTASELAEHLRAYLDDYSPHFRRTTTDAQILEAAQDAYEAALARRRRLEPVHGTARGGEATPIRAFRAPSDGA